MKSSDRIHWNKSEQEWVGRYYHGTNLSHWSLDSGNANAGAFELPL